MITKVELDREGRKVRVFHSTAKGQTSWTHPYREKKGCEVCRKL